MHAFIDEHGNTTAPNHLTAGVLVTLQQYCNMAFFAHNFSQRTDQ